MQSPAAGLINVHDIDDALCQSGVGSRVAGLSGASAASLGLIRLTVVTVPA